VTNLCAHKHQVERKDDPQHAWECADCGYIYGLDGGVKVVSGGQTGVDRLALDVAKSLGIPTGGWAAHDWMTEAGPDPSLKYFGLAEHSSDRYPPRTRANVRMADGTVWFGEGDSRGQRCTLNAAADYEKPFLINPDARSLRAWLKQHRIRVLNVAGSRGSKLTLDGEQRARSVLADALR